MQPRQHAVITEEYIATKINQPSPAESGQEDDMNKPPAWNITAIELELAILRSLPATDLIEHWERLQKIQADLASLFYTVTYQRAVNLAVKSDILEEENHE